MIYSLSISYSSKIFWVDSWYIAIHRHVSLQTGLRNIDYGINGTWRV